MPWGHHASPIATSSGMTHRLLSARIANTFSPWVNSTIKEKHGRKQHVYIYHSWLCYIYITMIFDDLMYLSNDFGCSFAFWKSVWYIPTLYLGPANGDSKILDIHNSSRCRSYLQFHVRCLLHMLVDRRLQMPKTNMVPIPTNPDFFLVNSTSQVWANDIFQEPDPFPEIKEGFPLQFTIFWPHNESFTRDQHAKLLRIFLVGFLGHDGPSNGWAVDSPKKVSILSCSHGRSWNRRQQSLIHPKISQNILIHHKNHATIHPTLSEIIMLQLEKNTYKMKGNEYWRYTPFSAEPRVSGRKR